MNEIRNLPSDFAVERLRRRVDQMSGVQMIERRKRIERPLAPECRCLLNAARVNIIGVTNLFEAARLAKLQRVIFASTVGIFGYQDGYGAEPIDEQTEPRATKSLYGLMKLVNNGLAERYTKTYGV